MENQSLGLETRDAQDRDSRSESECSAGLSAKEVRRRHHLARWGTGSHVANLRNNAKTMTFGQLQEAVARLLRAVDYEQQCLEEMVFHPGYKDLCRAELDGA